MGRPKGQRVKPKSLNHLDKKKIFIVMPAYNEGKVIGGVIQELKKRGYKNIIVIDDGSSDNTYTISKQAGVVVLRHRINRGLGGALNTGITAALKLGARIIVTFDSDGQHDVRDIPRIVQPIISDEADIVIGSRFLKRGDIPLLRRIGIVTLNILTFLLYGIYTTDSQSGLRAFSRRAALKINVTANRMEVSSEFFREIKTHNLRFKEIPIKAIYTPYSMRKGQSLLNGFKIMTKRVIRRFLH